MEIRVEAAASQLVMRSCSRCDGRWWSRDGASADLHDVLGSVARLSRKAG